MGKKELIVSQISEVFREHGFAATSLSLLTEKTGLERASLYHYFPRGKAEMAEVVLETALEQLQYQVLQQLHGERSAAQKLQNMLTAVWEFYHAGKDLCFVAVFGKETTTETIRGKLQRALQSWLTQLAQVLVDKGRPQAMQEASASLSLVQGSLLLSAVTGQSEHFNNALSWLARNWDLGDRLTC